MSIPAYDFGSAQSPRMGRLAPGRTRPKFAKATPPV
jgi:hypothetical protein